MENKNRQKEQYPLYLLMALAGVIFLLLMIFSPPNGEDWVRIGFRDRSFSGFVQLIGEQYETLNGRVMGNFFSYLLIAPDWLRILIKTVFLLGNVLVLWGFGRNKEEMSFVWTMVLYLGLSTTMIVQVFSWNIGFFYHILPVYFLMIYFLWQKMGQSDLEREREIPIAILFFILGMISSLFMESTTIVILLFSLLLLVYEKLGTGKIKIESICWTVGVVIGTIILFRSPTYSLEGMTLFAKGMGIASDNFFAHYEIFRGASPLSHFFLFLILFTGILSRYRRNYSKVDILMALIAGVFFIYALITRVLPIEFFTLNNSFIEASKELILIDFFVHLFFFVYLVVVGLHGIENRVIKRTWLMILAGILINFMIVFFLKDAIVNDYYMMMIFYILLSILILEEDFFQKESRSRNLVAIGLAAAIILSAYHLRPMMENDKIYQKNQIMLNGIMDKGLLEASVIEYPHPNYLVDPDNTKMMNAYYYKEKGDLEIKIRQ